MPKRQPPAPAQDEFDAGDEFDRAEAGDDDIELVSKSAIKRELAELTRLVGQLADQPDNVLDQAESRDLIDASTKQALTAAAKIRHGGARKREIKYISKRMRGVEIDQLRGFFADMQGASAQEKRREARISQLRDRLIDDLDAGLNAVFETYPFADRQQIRQLARLAAQDRLREQNKGHARKLIRLLREYALEQEAQADT